MFSLVFTSENTFDLLKGGEIIKNNQKVGEKIQFSKYQFVIDKIPGDDYKSRVENETLFSFQYKTPLQRAASLSKQLTISFVNKNSEILELKLTGPDANKNKYLLNKIVKYFDEDSQEDKRQVARKTKEFVDSRIASLILDLDTIENHMVAFMQGESYYSEEWFIQKYASIEGNSQTAERDLALEYNIVNSLVESVSQSQVYDLIPVDIGIGSPTINALIQAHNSLILSREKQLLVTTEKHPEVVVLSEQIMESKQDFQKHLIEYQQTLEEQAKEFNKERAGAESQLYTIPAKEKTLRNIIRQQSIKEELYLFLLEKRETAALSSAVTSPSIKVVDYAYTNPRPISPNRSSKYIIAFFVGLIIPIGLVYLKFLFDTKVHGKEDIRKKLGPNIPIVGEIPLFPSTSNWLITKNDRSELAEAFRVVRTNIDYMMPPQVDDPCKVIIVTSSTKSEGKTFASLNTALSLASGDHKVLLVGADLRNPQLHSAFEMDKNVPGLTTYLYEPESNLEDLTLKGQLGFESLDVILSGFIPPNPAELLLNNRFQQFMKEAKQKYEFIVIDSAPTILVTDTLLITQHANVCLYLVRSGVTETKILDHINDLIKQKKIPHLGVLLNGIGSSGSYGYRYKYNYGYGYAYGENTSVKKALWKRILFFWRR